MNSIEKMGKNVEEAVSEALKELKATREEVEITVIEQGSTGFLGIGSRLAKVLVTKKFDPENAAKTFLREIVLAMGISVEIKTELKDKHLFINMEGTDMGILIGKRGQTLDSLQYLISLAVNKGNNPYIGVTLDTENYRNRRKETLEALAHNLAKRVKATRKQIVLEPMNPSERRIIHSTLQGDKYVTTHSQGEEPYRNVVISLRK